MTGGKGWIDLMRESRIGVFARSKVIIIYLSSQNGKSRKTGRFLSFWLFGATSGSHLLDQQRARNECE